MKNKKTKIAIISVVALLLVLIGVTYAYWLVTKTQTNSNIVSSACLDITMDNEANDISLSSQYPLSNEEGMKLTPYTFKVINNCNTSIDYQIALESIGEEANAIASSAIKVALDDSAELLSNKATAATTVSGAYAAHKLGYGTLTAKGSESSSATHALRIWIDENAPISESNKTFQSKISVTVGQGISNPIKEGSLAYDILENTDEPITLSTTWVSKEPEAETYYGVYKTVNYWYGTSYILDDTGNYQLSGDIVQATLEECRNGTKQCGMYSLLRDVRDYNMPPTSTIYKITSFTNASKTDSGNKLYMTTQRITSKNDYSSLKTSEVTGVYKAIDDLGESYYFRGNVTNNYVQFGEYQAGVNLGRVEVEAYLLVTDDKYYFYSLEECQEAEANYDASEIESACRLDDRIFQEIVTNKETPMYWRIVRINGDGTIRLVYDGVKKVSNGVQHTTGIGGSSLENGGYTSAKYVGYTYDTSDNNKTQIDSLNKITLDTWYTNHLKTNYGSYIADGVFCNDREVYFGDYFDASWNTVSKENAVYYDLDYAAAFRLNCPRLTCPNVEDRYTMSSAIGNGYLANPIGLLTADEAILAGVTKNDYLYNGGDYITMSPSRVRIGENSFNSMGVWENGTISSMDMEYGTFALRPVINLRADVEFTGDGSLETPYVIKTN